MPVRVGLMILMLAAASAIPAWAQDGTVATAPLSEIRADGLKSLPEQRVVALTGLQTGAQVGKDDLPAAADKLVQSGLFGKDKYNFQSSTDGVAGTMRREAETRVCAVYHHHPCVVLT